MAGHTIIVTTWKGGGVHFFQDFSGNSYLPHIVWLGMSFFIIRFLENIIIYVKFTRVLMNLKGIGVDFGCQYYHYHCHVEGNFDIWIWILLLGNYKLFHHCCGTWMNFMEPPRNSINIWAQWFHLVIW